MHLLSNASHIRRMRRDKYSELIRNLSFSYKKENRERRGLRLKELKTHFPCTLVFFSSTKKRLVTNSTLSNYNTITTLYWSII